MPDSLLVAAAAGKTGEFKDGEFHYQKEDAGGAGGEDYQRKQDAGARMRMAVSDESCEFVG